jgi:hypothetical protein
MSVAIFVFGVFVFLITVYGTVVSGGLLLTDRQLEDQPDLAPDYVDPDDPETSKVRRLVDADF